MIIRPFDALRPTAELAAQVAAVPYDTVDATEARALAADNPNSFLHVSRPEIDMPDGAEGSSPAAYEQAARALKALKDRGVLVREGTRKYYAYRQTMGSHAQTGIVAVFDTQEYLSGALKQHEKTRIDKENDRLRHIEILAAQTGPAFLTYRDDPAIDAVVAEACIQTPLYDFTAVDGIRHTVWEIAAEGSCRADELQELFARIPVAYIADGHHRSAAASRYAQAHDFAGESRYFMATIFPASQLKILGYNRLVADLNGHSVAAIREKAQAVFKGGNRHCRMYLGGEWVTLAWSIPTGADPVSALDVSFLQDNFLAPVLGIGDPRTDARIAFMGGIRGTAALQAKVDEGAAAVAFEMEPVTVSEMMAIADAGQIMPPKSTWFEPKLRSGLFVHELD